MLEEKYSLNNEKVNIELETKNKVKHSMKWKFLERILAQGISFVIGVILARLLTPEDYGIVALTSIFITISNVFISSGFNNSLIQKKDANDIDYSTMFYCSLLISVICYFILFLLAPSIADFYQKEELKGILRGVALTLPISSLFSIQSAYVARNLIFKKFFFTTLIGNVLSGIVGITMAYSGFGPWALVTQSLASSIINTIVLLFIIPWRPRMVFSVKSAKNLMKYGYNIMFGTLISNIYTELHSFIIGKVYSADSLAYYKKGSHIPDLFNANIDSTICGVMFPAMSNFSDNPDMIKNLTRKTIRMSSYIVFPVMMGLFAISKPLILLLLTEKWEPSIIFMQLQCLATMTFPISNANCQAIKACRKK